MARTSSHKIETRSKDIFQQSVNNNDDAMFRILSERDYGIDGIVELFDNDNPTGQIAFIQIKGKEQPITQLSTKEEVSCSGISKSNFAYAHQHNIPVILVYISIARPDTIYYIELQRAVEQLTKGIKNTNTVRIPIENVLINGNMEDMFNIIRGYYRDEAEEALS